MKKEKNEVAFEKINLKKKPIVVIDETLDFFNDKILFPEKLEKANKMLKEIGLPKKEKNPAANNG